MKFRCDKEVLVGRLTMAGRALSNRPNLDVLNGLHMEAEGKGRKGQLTITGSDLDLTVRVRFDVDVEEPGKAVAARWIINTVRSLHGDEICIETDEAWAVASIVDDEDKEIKSRVEMYSAEDFPKLSGVEEFENHDASGGSEIDVSATKLARGIKQVAGAASDDFARPILTGVLFEGREDALRMVATDSYRLALCTIEGLGILKDGQKVIVPARALEQLGRLLPQRGQDADGNDSEVMVNVKLGDRDISFEVQTGIGTTQVITRLIEGEFPKYEPLIPEETPHTLAVDQALFVARTKEAKEKAREGSGTPVRLEQSPEAFRMYVKHQGVDLYAATVDGEFEGEPLTVAFNPDYLLDGLEAIESEQVRLNSTDELKPAVLCPAPSEDGADDDGFIYLMMPVRIT